MRPISEFMTKNPIAIRDDSTLAQVVKLMRQKEIGAILVKNKNDKTIGIFTERDLLTRIDFSKPETLTTLKVRDVMSKNLITSEAQQPYTDVLKLMQQYNIRHMPVMRDGQMIGIVSLRDLMIHYEENLENLLGEKESQLVDNLQRLRESEERMRLIFRNTAVAICYADNNERLISWNPLTEELIQMDEKDLHNKPLRDFFPPEEWKKIQALDIRRRGGHTHFETQLINKKKQLIDIDLSISFINDASGRITGSIAVMRDIRKRRQMEVKLHESLQALENEYTTLKEYQKQIIQMEKMVTMGTLAAGFAHEIKNPLAIILQGMERIQKSTQKREDREDEHFVKIIHNAAERANEVVTSILRYSRAAQMEVQQVDVANTIDSTVELVRNNQKIEDIAIRTQYPPQPLTVEGDTIMLQQVFFDIMMNAIDAMPNGGTIDIKVDVPHKPRREQVEKCVIHIKDTGVGIPATHLSRIFDPFFTTKEAGKGTGLGLSTVYLIIEKHKGLIDVKSRKGKGTEFTITLPTRHSGPSLLKETGAVSVLSNINKKSKISKSTGGRKCRTRKRLS